MNETLAELPAHTRLLFIGLWMLADRAGRLEDRPKRIKVELFPYEMVNVEEMLRELNSAGFIHRYSIEDGKFIQIRTFEKHQQCHINEARSAIPPHPDASTVQAPDKHGTSTGLARQEGKGTGTGKEKEQEGKGAARESAPAKTSLAGSLSDFFSEKFINWLQTEVAKPGVEVRHVGEKMLEHCRRSGKKPNESRYEAWVKREEPLRDYHAKEPGNGRERGNDGNTHEAKIKRVVERVIARRRSGEKEGSSA